MRRIIALLLLGSMFVLPAFTGCFPSGYEEENPARPAENQVDTDNLTPSDDPPAEETTVEDVTGE